MNNDQLHTLSGKLPQTPGILGKEEYFNSAVLIPLILINDEYYFLFEKRSASIRQGGEICFPGGEFDKGLDKNYRETAVRETEEELGIKREQINILGCLDTFIGPMGVTVDSFVAVIDVDDINNLNFDKDEVEKIFTIPVSFFKNNPPAEYEIRMEMHPYYVNEKGEKVDLFPPNSSGFLQSMQNHAGEKITKYIFIKPNRILSGV